VKKIKIEDWRVTPIKREKQEWKVNPDLIFFFTFWILHSCLSPQHLQHKFVKIRFPSFQKWKKIMMEIISWSTSYSLAVVQESWVFKKLRTVWTWTINLERRPDHSVSPLSLRTYSSVTSGKIPVSLRNWIRITLLFNGSLEICTAWIPKDKKLSSPTKCKS